MDDPFRSEALKAERDGTTHTLAFAEEQLVVARANYALAMRIEIKRAPTDEIA